MKIVKKLVPTLCRLLVMIICFFLLINISLNAQGLTIGSETTFYLGSAVLTIPNDWYNSGSFNAENGTVVFNGSINNQAITNPAGEIFNNLTVNKSFGDLRLNNNIILNGALTITNGDLDIDGNNLNFGSNASLIETAGNTVKGTSGKLTSTSSLNAPSGVNVGGLGAVITSSANLGFTTVERYHFPGMGTGNSGILRVYRISPTNNTGLNATLRLYYDETELSGIGETQLRLFRSPTGQNNTWSLVGGTINTSNNYIEVSGINSFSYWTLADIDRPVPVELTSFAAVVEDKSVILNWATATETQNQGWDIECKSGNTSGWKKIGFVPGAGDRTEPAFYKFKDDHLLSGKILYRLKQIDFDGSFSFSNEIEIEILAPLVFELLQNYPNPFNPETVIEFTLPNDGYAELIVYNALGEEAAKLFSEFAKAGQYYRIKFSAKVGSASGGNASQFPSGIYFAKLQSGNNRMVKKMLYMK